MIYEFFITKVSTYIKQSFYLGGVVNKIIIVFANRSHSQMLAKFLLKAHIPCTLVSTPRELGTSCGLSVKCVEKYMPFISGIIGQNQFTSFKGIFREVPLSNFKNNYIRI